MTEFRAVRGTWKLDRILLAVYLTAMIALLTAPVSGPTFRIIDIGLDKFLHVALFGGLAVLLRLNLAGKRHANLITLGLAFVVAASSEGIQGLIVYRSAELLDLLAGLVGALFGTIATHQIKVSGSAIQLLAITIALSGLFTCSLSIAADAVGVGDGQTFGPVQISGTVLGGLVIAGGIATIRAGKQLKS